MNLAGVTEFAKLMADTEALVRDNPSKLPMQTWSDQLQKRLET